MAVREILTYPHPLLKQAADPITDFGAELEQLVNDLSETLHSFPGCVGIAAPQVGVLKRVIVVDASRNRKPVDNHGLLILINPTIEGSDEEEVMREGCLSIPDFTANVKRAKRILLTATTRDATIVSLEAADFEARVIQHEFDHLDGKLFLDRVASLKTDVFRRKRYAVPDSTG
jgi:peptide deformylase